MLSAATDSPSHLQRIGKATLSFDRNALLRNLGVDFVFLQTGDVGVARYYILLYDYNDNNRTVVLEINFYSNPGVNK